MNKLAKGMIGAVIATLTVLSLAACTGEPKETSTPKPTSTINPNDPSANLAELKGTDTLIVLDKSFSENLNNTGITVNVTGGGTVAEDGVHLNITGGDIKYFDANKKVKNPRVEGSIYHEGTSLNFRTQDGKLLELAELVINNTEVRGSVLMNGTDGGAGVPVFRLDESTLKPIYSNPQGAAVFEGSTLYLTESSAQFLNDVSGTSVFKADTIVGTTKITASIIAPVVSQ